MVRPRSTLVVIVVVAVVAILGGGTAQARRLICEADPQVQPAEAGITLAPADEERPASPVREVCRPGVVDDPSCWPDTPIPERGPHVAFGWSGWSALPSGTVSPRRPFAIRPPGRTATHPLSAGYARRIERPPRAV